MSDADDDIKRFPDLGKLSITLVESLVKPVIGGETIKVAKQPYLEKELRKSLTKVLTTTERRFTQEYADKEICTALLELQIADLPSFQKIVRDFYKRPYGLDLQQYLTKRLLTDFPKIKGKNIDQAVSFLLNILRQELISLSGEIREKINSIAVLSSEQHTQQIVKSSEQIEQNTGRIAQRLEEVIEIATSHKQSPAPLGKILPLPTLVIGRERDFSRLKRRLGIASVNRKAKLASAMTVIRGWPGVGKTTLAASLAYDTQVQSAFQDGILWVSLGPFPSVKNELAFWGRALGHPDLLIAESVKEASYQLAAILRDRRMLLIVDDVWEKENLLPFKVGGPGCAMLVTTRSTEVALAVTTTAGDVYHLDNLTEKKSLELLKVLAPQVVKENYQACLELVHDLEGLPLSIQVAGHLLNAEYHLGFKVTTLVEELRNGKEFLQLQAPLDQTDEDLGITPTIAVLLNKSTDRLDSLTQDSFACLAPLAPKPAQFDLAVMAAAWETDDPIPIARKLVEHGLLEPVGNKYFQMHALLVWHARALYERKNLLER